MKVFSSISFLLLSLVIESAVSLSSSASPSANGSTTTWKSSLYPISFGTLNLDTNINDEENLNNLKSLFEEMPDNTLIDTAEIYGPEKKGETEQMIGKLISLTQQQQKEEKFKIATKFAPQPWRRNGPSDVVSACKASLERLQRDQIDLYQIHYPDRGIFGNFINDEGYWEGMAQCYELGLTKHIGVCNYGPEYIQRAHTFFVKERGIPLTTNQINFNLMSFRRAQETRDICDALNIEILGYHPIGNGVLTDKYTSEVLKEILTDSSTDQFSTIKVKARRMKWYQKNCAPLLQTLSRISESRGKSMATCAVNWTISKKAIPICGVRNLDQLKDIIAATEFSLTAEEIQQLDQASNESAEYAKGFDLI